MESVYITIPGGDRYYYDVKDQKRYISKVESPRVKSPSSTVVKPTSPRVKSPSSTVVKPTSRTSDWRDVSPKKGKERDMMYEKCGDKCFLLPEKQKFPICRKDTCEIDCRGLVAAKIRASQHGYYDIREKSDILINKLGCTQKSRSMMNPRSPRRTAVRY